MDTPDTDGRPISPFAAHDCALISLATSVTAENLREFRDGLLRVHKGSIYHHFWGRLLRPHFDEPEYLNDFASWAFHGLHEMALAERLSLIDPTDFTDLEDLRRELVEVVEQRLDESEYVPWARTDQRFYFVRARLVVFDTGRRVQDGAELATLLPELSTGSVYYHFIDARRRTASGTDDFTAWVCGHGPDCTVLAERLAALDPYFSSLKETRRRLAEIFAAHYGLPEATGAHTRGEPLQ